jgi:lipopolysaccharide/colanic/teichoic acid biosynthesis glycosyltransferase
MYKHFIKRLLDIILSLIAIIVLSPLFLVIAFWINELRPLSRQER